MFVNDPKAFPHTYKRYLLSVLRDQLPFGEVPIKLYLQTRTQTTDKDTGGKKNNAKRA
jgi:GTP-binding protein